MGGLFSKSRRKLPDEFIDFNSATASDDEERALVESFDQNIMRPGEDILNRLANYTDAKTLIAASISHPSEETNRAAFDALLPNVQFQSESFNFTSIVVDNFLELLDYILDKIRTEPPISVLAQHPAIVKTFAQSLHTILRFDEIILTLPNLLGDLAHFRRNASRILKSGDFDELIQKTAEITIFFGTPNPALSRLVSSLGSHFGGEDDKIIGSLNVFAALIDLFTSSLSNNGNSLDQDTQILALRGIVGATLLYDHSSANGAFNRTVPMAIEIAMSILCNFTPQQKGLINSIRYSSKHINDPNTLPEIRDLFH